MPDILDDVIAATRSGPRIVSENHNLGSINFVAGLSDPGEMIACGYLPQLRRLAGEQDKEYQERILPSVMALSQSDRDRIMGAAIKRASIDVSNGKIAVMVAGEPAWHGLGVNVESAVSPQQAKLLCGADWTVEKMQDYYVWAGQAVADPGAFALVRSDTGARLNTVGSGYQVIQNDDLFDFFDQVFHAFGAKIETAGCLYGGKTVWAQAALKDMSFTLPGGDENTAYAMFSNKHGDGAATFFPTNLRTVCANTHRISMGDKDRGFSIRHTGNLKSKVEQAQGLLGIAKGGMEQYREQAETLSRTYLDVEKYADEVLDMVLGVTKAEMDFKAKRLDPIAVALEIDAADKALNRLKRTNDELFQDILERYETDRCEPKGTAWAALNATTETFEHGPYKRKGQQGSDNDKRSRRFESVLSGDVDAAVQVAYQQALAVV